MGGSKRLTPSTFLIEYLKGYIFKKYGTHLDLTVSQLKMERVYAGRILSRLSEDEEDAMKRVSKALAYLKSREWLLSCGSLKMAASNHNLIQYQLTKMQQEEEESSILEDASSFLDYRKLLGD